MYWKIHGNQSGRSYKTGIHNCSWLPCIQVASLHSGSVTESVRISFMTCSSYTTCCKARKMSQDCDFCWEGSFLCSVSSKSRKGDDIYYTHHTKSNTVHGRRQAHLGKILTNGSFPDMIPAPWAGPRRMQQAAGKSGLQGVCTLKKESQIVTSQEEQHSRAAAIPHCLTTLTNLTAFKLSQHTSPHLQIIIWMPNNQYEAKSPARQGQQSCLCIPEDSGGKAHAAEPARTGSTFLGSTRRNTTQANHC